MDVAPQLGLHAPGRQSQATVLRSVPTGKKPPGGQRDGRSRPCILAGYDVTCDAGLLAATILNLLRAGRERFGGDHYRADAHVLAASRALSQDLADQFGVDGLFVALIRGFTLGVAGKARHRWRRCDFFNHVYQLGRFRGSAGG